MTPSHLTARSRWASPVRAVATALLARLPRLEAMIWNARTAFVARTLLAMALALYAALFLQLSSPGSAAVTVAIVANTSRGGMVSKGLWRICGTVTGAIVTIILFAWFAQAPLLFLAMFGLWLGVCVFVAGMLRHFRSYSAVLAGYTVAIITAGALADPANVLQYALSRVAVVSLGVISAGIVSMVFQPGTTFDGVVTDFRVVMVKIIEGLQQRDFAEHREVPPIDYAGTSALLNALDAGIEFAGTEAPDVARRAGTLRRGVAALHAAFLSVPVVRRSLQSLEKRARAQAGSTPLAAWIADVDAVLRSAADGKASDLRALHGSAIRMRRVAREGSALLGETVGREHLAEVVRVQRQLEILDAAILHFIDEAGSDGLSDPARPLRAFRDYQDSRRNAVRAAVATWLAGLFCYATAWTQTGACLGIVASLCALLATAPDPSAASVEFTKGAILATIAAYVCEFMLLPHISGFPLFFLAMMPFLAIGCYTITIPRLNSRSFGYVVLFLTQLTIANTMRFNALAFFNGAVAYVLSGVATVLVFRVLLPVNAAREVRRFVNGIGASSERYLRTNATRGAPLDWLGWVVTLNQSVQLAMGRLRQSEPKRVAQLVNDSGALVLLTFEVIRLRTLIRDGAVVGPEAQLCEAALAKVDGLRVTPEIESGLSEAVDELLSSRADVMNNENSRLTAASGLQSILLLFPAVERLMSLSRPEPVFR